VDNAAYAGNQPVFRVIIRSAAEGSWLKLMDAGSLSCDCSKTRCWQAASGSTCSSRRQGRLVHFQPKAVMRA
jgi:hypothetical protein